MLSKPFDSFAYDEDIGHHPETLETLEKGVAYANFEHAPPLFFGVDFESKYMLAGQWVNIKFQILNVLDINNE